MDQTAFYPTSGGQPHDIGVLNQVPVLEVVDEEHAVVHIVAGDPPPIGSAVTGQINRARRLDHTEQHSGQHILSQAFERTGRLKTVSFHLGPDTCTIDLDRADVDRSAVREAEALANDVVLEDRSVKVHLVDEAEVERFDLRKPTKRTGMIRIVEIDDFDRSACGGTHVVRTGQVGPIKVRRWERRGSTTRVEFLCGRRALRDYAQRLELTRSLAERLRVKDDDVVSAVERSLDELARVRADFADAQERLLDREATDLLRGAVPLPILDGAKLVRASWVDRGPDELKRLALRLTTKETAVALLASGGTRRQLVFAQTPGLPYDLAALLRTVGPLIGARGGGTRDLAQGGSPAPGAADLAIDEAARLVSGSS